MANEAENLVLIQLREIRAKLEKLEKLDSLERRLDAFKAEADQWKGYITHIFGLASMSNLRNDALEAGISEKEMRLKRIEQLAALIDRRVTRLEDLQPTH